jgi:hypothetical protein
MNHTTRAKTTKANRFVLSRLNQKGQVAIFVALIFQVVFVFFALLINVGLLVHQKINLQQSVDLAAYYGAGKQAEVLNALAHVNFQIKQNWKLMTWRYRILGTFGFQKDQGADSQVFPFETDGSTFTFNGRDGDSTKCPMTSGNPPLGSQDIPFFCAGHGGFSDWVENTETACRLGCSGFTNAYSIPAIPTASGITTPEGGNVAGEINAAISIANTNVTALCNVFGPIGAKTLSRFIAAYSAEALLRKRTLEMLAKNLSKEADKELDLDGEPIFKGVKTTLLNNLTEANKTGFLEAKLAVENGLSKCPYDKGSKNSGGREFLKRIEFDFINYFIHNCTYAGGANYQPESVFNSSTSTGLSLIFNSAQVPPEARDVVMALLTEGQKHTVGYEKNPNCVEYYAVKASSSPTIPFLPLAKIQLNALAIAKPFGGTIGPSFGKTWAQNTNYSQYTDSNPATKVDQNAPFRDSASLVPTDVTQSYLFQPNFSLFVGDTKGLRDSDYIAAYHSALAMRDIKKYGAITEIEANKNTSSPLKLINDGEWPAYKNWDAIADTSMVDLRQYDSLAANRTGTRALEISVVAPNQFDINYYSIEPDFFNTYYKRMYNSFAKYKAFLGGEIDIENANQIRADFGAIVPDAAEPAAPALANEKTFSVRDQILIKNQIFQNPPEKGSPRLAGKTYAQILNYLVSLQSSLLTGWSFLNYSTYSIFPGGNEVNRLDKNMTFGRCADPWNTTPASPGAADLIEPNNFQVAMNVDPQLPPAQGNCVTGGRVGYSVKIVSPDMVRKREHLDNPISSNMLDF